MSKSKMPDLTRFKVPRPSAALPSDPGPPYKLKAFRVRTAASKQLAMLKVTTGRNQQDLLADALNLLFEHRGLPPVA